MKTKITLVLLLVVMSVSGAFAHALWIETSSNGENGKAQEVKIFFGEYESKEPDSAKKWFSNLKEFNLVLTAPNGNTKILKASPDVLFYKAAFTPDQDGAYKLSIVHVVADVYEHAKIEYYAFADVAVGKVKLNNSFPLGAVLTIRPEQPTLKINESSANQLIYKNAPLAKQKVTVINPDGKKQEPETDANGKFSYKANQKGIYFLEAFTEDKKAGKLNGKEFEKIWYLITYTTSVK